MKTETFRVQASRILMVATLLPLLAAIAVGENWPGWRGPNRNGISSEQGIPTEWSETKNVLWKTAIAGYGISNPVVWDEKVILTDSDGKNLSNLHVICLSRDTGKEQWHLQLWGTSPTRHHSNKSSMASPSPVTDGRHVFAFFGTGDVFCIDMEGNLIWHRSLTDEYGVFENRFAASSSPILYEDTILLQCDHYGDSYIVALDKATGANRWKYDRPGRWLSWSSPQLVPVEKTGNFEFVVCGSHQIEAFDPVDGRPLWHISGMRRECIPTPVFAHGLLYAVSGPKGPTMAIKPGGRGDVAESHVVWSNNRGAPFVPSAILVGDYYYLVDDQGIGTCLDAHTGKNVWQKRLNGKFTASPVAADGKIYFTDEAGQTTVIEANVGRYSQLAKNSVNEPVFGSPAISQGRLFIRTARHLYCVGQRR